MISRRRMLAAKVHLPLRQLALCLDCDECFEISSPTCPACGSATWTSLSRFGSLSSSQAIARISTSISSEDSPGTGPFECSSIAAS